MSTKSLLDWGRKAVPNLASLLWLTFAGTSVKEARRLGLRVARFRGDRPAALTFTFDDGFPREAEEALALLEGYGFRGTFFANPGPTYDRPEEGGNRLSWARWREVLELGHEVGNHSLNHTRLHELDDKALDREVNQAFHIMTEKLGVPPFTFCCPGGTRKTDRVLAKIREHHQTYRDREFVYGGSRWSPAIADKWVDDAIRWRSWIVPMFHGISEGYDHFPCVDDLYRHLQYIKDREDQIWVDTFGRITRYIRERDSAHLAARAKGEGVIIKLTTSLDPDLYDEPLTVIVPVSGVVDAAASREGEKKPLPVEFDRERILLEVRPGEAPVSLAWRRR